MFVLFFALFVAGMAGAMYIDRTGILAFCFLMGCVYLIKEA